MFLVAGDPPEPAGAYDGVVAFLRDFLAHDHGLHRIGVTAYPDGHALIPDDVHTALHDKQALLAEAGVEGFASTQMCFDVNKWKAWATAEREAGLTLPLHLGVPGSIDRMKLLTMGMRLGIGASMRFVKKNGRGVRAACSPRATYDPTKLVGPLAKVAPAAAASRASTCSRSTMCRQRRRGSRSWKHAPADVPAAWCRRQPLRRRRVMEMIVAGTKNARAGNDTSLHGRFVSGARQASRR